MKYYLKKGMFWTKSKDDIIFYYTNPYLRKGILSSDNTKLFNLLTLLSEPKTYDEIYSNSPFEQQEDLDKSLAYLTSKRYISRTKDYFNKVQNRLRSFVDSIPNINFEDYQKKIDSTHICIIGTGTAGSYLPESLIKLGLSKFTLIDPDIVEEHNLYAQNFSYLDLGEYKVYTLKKRYEKYYNNLLIKADLKHLKKYEDLKMSIDLEQTDYLLLCADNNELIVDVIENIFNEYPHIKIIIGGYAVFQQYYRLITRGNYISVLNNIKKNVNTLKKLEKVLVENNGVIFDSLFSAIAVSKMVFDDILNINQSHIAKADFLKNTFFIGNELQNKMFEEYENNPINKIFYNFPENTEKQRWIKDITEENIFNNNLLLKKEIAPEEKIYLIEKTDKTNFNKLMNFQDTLNSLLNTRHYPSLTKEYISELLLDYIEKHFDARQLKQVKSLLHDGFTNVKSSHFVTRKPQTLKIGDKVFIHNIIDNNNISTLNSFVLNVFKALLQLNGVENIYQHISFSLNNHLRFLNYFSDVNLVYDLQSFFLKEIINKYTIFFITNEYEKYSYLDNISEFVEEYDRHTKKRVLVETFKKTINTHIPFSNYKYVYAINNNINEIIKLAETSISSLAENLHEHV
ncbi:ThiF family adenylyltransferase [Bacillus vallismortis]|uniref:ThiF family adenylyltransferase n=1 Tax=Bacillus vallismortis TaxID=72361 RepID=UPI003DB12FC7